ncbi:MAG: vWA domain-containing protein [Sphingobacteriales bacterium]|jgi:uncharacterized protein with von Willebrand factor type A (vWA) domain
MGKVQAFQSASLSESIVGFAQFARDHGLNIGIQETQDALKAASMGILLEKAHFRQGLRSLFCTSPEEILVFDQLFSLYWNTNPIDLDQRKGEVTLQGSVNKKTNASLVMLGSGNLPAREEEEEAKHTTGANEVERLKKADLSLLTAIEAEQLEEIARKLCRQMAVRMRRRMKFSQKAGQLYLRKTIHRSMATGGEPFRLFHRARKPRKQRLLIFLDVSGSMDKYSLFLLRFICALRDHFRQLEAFVFSTSLKRITRGLQSHQLETVLKNLEGHTDHWSSGTRIGECLQQFNDMFGKRMLNGSPTVLILSDGLDTGDVTLLGSALQRIHSRAKRTIWLNPLKGMKNYQPLARGMQAALPSVDDFRSAHSLESLLELENMLMNA